MAGTTVKQLAFAGTATLVRSGKVIISVMKYINEDAGTRFCQIYDAASVASVTVGTTPPAWILTAPANAGDDDFFGELVFDNGIVVAGTTTATGAGAAAGASQHFFVVVN